MDDFDLIASTYTYEGVADNAYQPVSEAEMEDDFCEEAEPAYTYASGRRVLLPRNEWYV